MKCVNHPGREATFDVPSNFCNECWVEWWVAVLPEEDREKEKARIMAEIQGNGK